MFSLKSSPKVGELFSYISGIILDKNKYTSMELSHNRIIILGAGGAGVSNIAQMYHERGWEVIGVDRQVNVATENLAAKGIEIYLESDQEKLALVNPESIVFRSSAVPDTNPWILKAREVGATVKGRHEFFRELSLQRDLITIAGSSGKTSTTGIVAHIFGGAGDFGHLIGIHGNGGHWGTEAGFVLEADEYAKTFLEIERMNIALITNLGYDHVDIYPTQKEYDQAFLQYAQTAFQSGGKVVAFGDNQQLRKCLADTPYISYGKNLDNDWTCREIKNFEGGSQFEVWHKNFLMAKVKLSVIGGHNVMNALAGFVVAHQYGLSISTIVKQLASFRGVPRRLELLRSNPYFVYDDYAHLPGEIETVLRGVRESFPKRRIVCYWQPHTYTRANHFFRDYQEALHQCDVLFVGDVYAARDEGTFDMETFINGIEGPSVVASGTVNQSQDLIESELATGDVLICLNAGTGTKIAHYFGDK